MANYLVTGAAGFIWEPQMALVEGMKHLVDWYRRECDWAKEVATP